MSNGCLKAIVGIIALAIAIWFSWEQAKEYLVILIIGFIIVLYLAYEQCR